MPVEFRFALFNSGLPRQCCRVAAGIASWGGCLACDLSLVALEIARQGFSLLLLPALGCRNWLLAVLTLAPWLLLTL